MTYHILKIESDSFEAIRGGGKQFEIRFNDRDYQQGDILCLREWHSEKGFSGRSIQADVTYMKPGQRGLLTGWVVLGISVFYVGDTESELKH